MPTDTRRHFHATATDPTGQQHTITDLYAHPTTAQRFARGCFRARGVQPVRGSVVVREWTAEEVEAYQQRMQELRKEWAK